MGKDAAVFYLSNEPHPERSPVRVPGRAHPVYIRVDLFTMGDDEDLSDILDKAKPRKGENVMNSHFV